MVQVSHFICCIEFEYQQQQTHKTTTTIKITTQSLVQYYIRLRSFTDRQSTSSMPKGQSSGEMEWEENTVILFLCTEGGDCEK